MTTQTQLEERLPESALHGYESALCGPKNAVDLLLNPGHIPDEALRQIVNLYPGDKSVLNAVVERGSRSASVLLLHFEVHLSGDILEKITMLYAGSQTAFDAFRERCKHTHRE